MTALSRTRPLPSFRRAWPIRRALPFALAAAVLVLPACSSSSDGGGSAGAGTAAEPASGGGLEPCALLEPAEVKALVPGAPDEGEQQGDGTCFWEDPTTYHSVTVHIGIEKTAADGELPEPEAVGAGYEDGPDGIRFSLGGTMAEFVAGTRVCDIQVVNGKEAKADLVALVGKLKSRVSS